MRYRTSMYHIIAKSFLPYSWSEPAFPRCDVGDAHTTSATKRVLVQPCPRLRDPSLQEAEGP